MTTSNSFLQGWGFRTATPSFESGDVIEVNITGYDEEKDTAVARIGDTVLRINGTTAKDVDTECEVRVIEFDEASYTGRAERTV